MKEKIVAVIIKENEKEKKMPIKQYYNTMDNKDNKNVIFISNNGTEYKIDEAGNVVISFFSYKENVFVNLILGPTEEERNIFFRIILDRRPPNSICVDIKKGEKEELAKQEKAREDEEKLKREKEKNRREEEEKSQNTKDSKKSNKKDTKKSDKKDTNKYFRFYVKDLMGISRDNIINKLIIENNLKDTVLEAKDFIQIFEPIIRKENISPEQLIMFVETGILPKTPKDAREEFENQILEKITKKKKMTDFLNKIKEEIASIAKHFKLLGEDEKDRND